MADIDIIDTSNIALPGMSDAACVGAVSSLPAIRSILNVICRTTGVGLAVVARVTEQRWVACAVLDEIGFDLQPGQELDIDTTFCKAVRDTGMPVVMDDAVLDPAYPNHPAPKRYKFRSYISMPVTLPDGTFFGTLCGLDPAPKQLNTVAVTEMFRLFSDLIAFQLDAHAKVMASQADLRRERDVAELREQFIAVLGHDLRNPLAAIMAGTRRLQRTPADLELVTGHMAQAATRMARLIDNVLDFARGRLGGGLSLAVGVEPIEPVLRQILSEAQASAPDRVILMDIALGRPVLCDAARIGQLFSNLLGNAIHHGSPAHPIRVMARLVDEVLEVSVTNGGEPIAPEVLSQLFQPYVRGKVRPNQSGLGLGLYIAAEIARAHAGTLTVQSSAAQTRFTLRMPAGA